MERVDYYQLLQNSMLKITQNISIPESEVEISTVRSHGPGGQNINKVSSAVHLRFDIQASSLPGVYKKRLLKLNDKRINKEDVLVIKSREYRSQRKNREIAIERLKEFIRKAAYTRKIRIATKPTAASTQKRLDMKTRRGLLKVSRKKINKVDE